MKITIQNGELEQKVGIALKGVNGRNSTKPILKCIIIKAKEDEILLEATNLWITGEGRRNGRRGRMLCD